MQKFLCSPPYGQQLETYKTKSLQSFLEEAGDQPLGYDIETSSLFPQTGVIVGLSLASAEAAIYIPFVHQIGPNSGLTYQQVMELLFSQKRKLIAFRGQFEQAWLWCKMGRRLVLEGDASILLKMLQTKIFGLKDAVEHYKIGTPVRLKDLLPEGKFDFSTLDASNPLVVDYTCGDAWNALKLETLLRSHKTIQKTMEVYRLELAVQSILAVAEATGVTIDVAAVRRKTQEFKAGLDKLEVEIFQAMGLKSQAFKINSTKKLAEQLFTKMGIRPSRFFRTKTGFSTSAKALKAIRDQHPVVEKLLDWKHKFSVWNNNLTTIEDFVRDGRVYTSFEQVGLDATSRCYTHDVNFTALPQEVRACMALSPDRKVVKFDFSAAELVIMAAMSGDKTLINAFRQGVDPHKAVYSQMTGKPVVQLSKEEREKGKTLNYGMMYGGTEFTLARQLGISTEEARELRSKYLDSVPQVGELVSKIQKECLDTTYTKTIMGRRRRLPEVKSADQAAVAKALRQSVNTCCQSSCGDLLKQAMVDIQSEMDKDSKWQGVQLICPVFDAAAYSVPRDLVSDFKELLQRVAPRHLPVATGGELELKVVVEVGDNWGFEEFEPPEDEDEGEN